MQQSHFGPWIPCDLARRGPDGLTELAAGVGPSAAAHGEELHEAPRRHEVCEAQVGRLVLSDEALHLQML